MITKIASQVQQNYPRVYTTFDVIFTILGVALVMGVLSLILPV